MIGLNLFFAGLNLFCAFTQIDRGLPFAFNLTIGVLCTFCVLVLLHE